MSSRLLSTTLRQSSKRLVRALETPRAAQTLMKVSAASSLHYNPVRYSSSAVSKLRDVFKSEFKISNTIPNEFDQSLEDYLQSSGFEIIEKDGFSNVQLKKTTDDGEVISVFFDIDEVTDVPLNENNLDFENEESNIEDIEEEIDSLDSLLCSVKVLIENPANNNGLFFNLFLQGSESSFMIDFVNFQSNVSSFVNDSILPKGEFIDKFKYQGPRFSDLDESLQTSFENYLDAKGIDNNLAEFILSFSEYKEEKEYRKWLTDISSYLKDAK